jgi:acetylornithine deacetylase
VGRSTNILVGSVQGGVNGKATVVGSACTLSAAISFPPGEPMEAVQAEVEAALREAAAGDPWLRENPPVLTWLSGVTGAEVPVEHPLYRTVSAAIAAVTGQEPFVNAMHTSSDIRNPMVQKGIPTVGLGPLCGDLTQTGRHDEWVDVADYRRCVAVAAQLIAEWCGAT